MNKDSVKFYVIPFTKDGQNEFEVIIAETKFDAMRKLRKRTYYDKVYGVAEL